MPVLYTFYRVETNPEKKRTSHSSKGRTDDKLLTINKSNKRKSSIKDSEEGIWGESSTLCTSFRQSCWRILERW